jgi:UDP-glucuronate 4-epimerase
MANYLVTGVAGFIAFRVTQLLLEAGHIVTGVDNLNDAYDVRIKTYRLSLLEGKPGFKFYKVDITSRSDIEKVFRETATTTSKAVFDGVINLAARAGVRQSLENPWAYVDTNITGTLNLLEMCRLYAIRKFILASTSSIYGKDAPLPTSEDADSDHPLQPYAASKKGAEALCHAYHFLHGLDVTILRYFTVYGPAGRPDMVMFRFTQWINEGLPVKVNGDGEQMRGFTYMDDIARGTILGLKPLGYEIINLGGHEVIRINQLIHLLEDHIGKNANIEYLPRHPADMLANWANVEKAKRMLGWEPLVGLNTGITKLVDWYTSERSWASQIVTD